jgi:nucleotide-binding universal stress UspA family protein
MKILAAVDGSDAAFHAFRSACRIAQKTYSSIVAFYVNKGEEYTPDETGWISLTEKIANELETLGHEVIRKTYNIGRELDVSVEGIMSYGIPPAEILNYVDAHGIVKLIAMGHSIQGRGAEEFVESAARAVVARARVPVFVSSAEIDIRRILIAVDNSEVTKRVAAFGGKLAQSLGAELGVVAFVPDMEAMMDEYRLIAEVPNIEKHLETSEKDLKELLDRAIDTATSVLGPLGIAASPVVKVGHADALISEAAQYDALVLGVKSGHSSTTLTRIANKLLDSHSVNSFFVQ